MNPNTDCRHDQFIKYGRRKTRKAGFRQRYKCTCCGKCFVRPEFKGLHFRPKIVLQALQLYAAGLTLREIIEFLQQPKSHVTVWNWLQRYSHILYQYTKKLQPQLVFQLHVDELFLRMQNRFYYLFDSIDAVTRYAVLTLQPNRTAANAAVLFQQSPKTEYYVSDGLLSYQKYLRKQFSYKWLRSHYYRHHTFQSKHNNNMVERLQGTLRRFLHPRRGFKSLKTANTIIAFYQMYYNYIRVHTTLGTTPAEKAGVIKYKTKNKWLELIKRAYSSILLAITNRILNKTH
jgi:putative transposase